ncbi:hypothetical protein [Flammeovirga pectinis]|uniref:hypothetical protein n=1 Tax=Flammeovirga pectinis TaxID=2494373 RepID=UPI0012D7A71A|nr:hypothetical protein [Flammeovirga pectinis]
MYVTSKIYPGQILVKEFKSFDLPEYTISGIETVRMIQKDQLSDRKGMSNLEAFKSLAV